jgi:hypothetical protein
MMYTAAVLTRPTERRRLTRRDWAWIRLFIGAIFVTCSFVTVYVIAPAMGVTDRPVHLEVQTTPQTVPPPGTLP